VFLVGWWTWNGREQNHVDRYKEFIINTVFAWFIFRVHFWLRQCKKMQSVDCRFLWATVYNIRCLEVTVIVPPGLLHVTWMKTAPTPGHCRRCTCSSALLTAQSRCPLHLDDRVWRIAFRYGQRATSADAGWPCESTAVRPTTCSRRLVRHSSLVTCFRAEPVSVSKRN